MHVSCVRVHPVVRFPCPRVESRTCIQNQPVGDHVFDAIITRRSQLVGQSINIDTIGGIMSDVQSRDNVSAVPGIMITIAVLVIPIPNRSVAFFAPCRKGTINLISQGHQRSRQPPRHHHSPTERRGVRPQLDKSDNVRRRHTCSCEQPRLVLLASNDEFVVLSTPNRGC